MIRGLRRATLALLVFAGAGCDALVSKPSLYGAVRAEVVRRDSTPIAGAQLLLYEGSRPMGYASTDATGSHTFQNVPEGVFGIRAEPPPGFVRVDQILGGPDTGYRDRLELVGGKLISARFTFLKLGNGLVTARVRETDGTPVQNVPVTLYTGKGEVERGVTDSSGAYSFAKIPLGNYGVFVQRSPLYLDSAEAARVVKDGLLVEAGSNDTAQFVFARCLATLTAQVRDNAGGAVPGALLTLYRGNSVNDYVLGADATRQFTDLGCGQYGIRVRPPAGYTVTEAIGHSYLDQIGLHRGQSVTATLVVTRIGRGSIRLHVVDDIGSPLENIRVVLYTGANVIQDVKTDASGTVVFSNLLVNAEYGVRAVPRAGYTVREANGFGYFDGIVLTDGAVRNLTFVFKRD